jgi:hypothetical protein
VHPPVTRICPDDGSLHARINPFIDVEERKGEHRREAEHKRREKPEPGLQGVE